MSDPYDLSAVNGWLDAAAHESRVTPRLRKTWKHGYCKQCKREMHPDLDAKMKEKVCNPCDRGSR